MKISQLNEALSIYTDGSFKFADIDVEGLYKQIIPKEMSVISNEEVQKVREFLDLDNVETEEELRAIRNTIVKYCTEVGEGLEAISDVRKRIWLKENPNGKWSDWRKQDPYEIMWDQMSAFTHVIDMELNKRFGHV